MKVPLTTTWWVHLVVDDFIFFAIIDGQIIADGIVVIIHFVISIFGLVNKLFCGNNSRSTI